MGYEWLAILMFVGFFFLLLSGYPVAFSFAGTAIVFGLMGLTMDAFDLALHHVRLHAACHSLLCLFGRGL